MVFYRKFDVLDLKITACDYNHIIGHILERKG